MNPIWEKVFGSILNGVFSFTSNRYNSRLWQWIIPEKGNQIINGPIYRFLDESLDSEKPDKSVISAAYWLTDLFDKSHEFDKAAELCRKVLRRIPEDTKSADEIRMIIGSWYSIFKNVRSDKAEWFQDIVNAEVAYKNIEVRKQIKDCTLDHNIQSALSSLFESDYGGLLLNKWKVYKDNDVYLKEALKRFESALKIRKEAGLEEYYTTLGSLATVQFYLKDYDAAIKLHKEALDYFNQHKKRQSAINSKRLITGCYEMKEKASSGALSKSEWNECFSYLNECKEYYKENTDLWNEVKDRLDRMKKHRKGK